MGFGQAFRFGFGGRSGLVRFKTGIWMGKGLQVESGYGLGEDLGILSDFDWGRDVERDLHGVENEIEEGVGNTVGLG